MIIHFYIAFSMGTHTGTHIDAPAHIFENGKRINEIPIEQFSGKLVKVNDKANKTITVEDLNGIDGVIFETGWYRNFFNPKIFYGPNRPNIPKGLIRLLIKSNVKIFGCDLPSVDPSGDKNKNSSCYTWLRNDNL